MTKTTDDNQNPAFEEAMVQFVDSQLWEHEPNIDAFVKRYPEFEHQIRKRIRKIQKIHTLFESLVRADESDFSEAVTGQNLVGKKIDSFEITDMIGSGGMGVVYLAHDTKLKRSVALKSMPAQLKDNSTARMRFRREAELLASLNHPNIAVIHDIIEQDDGAGYLVLEYVPGETLTERIKREPLKLDEALSIARQIAEAVSTAHMKDVVHRDLKPGNIKLTPEGRVKVLDFGLAKSSVGEGKDIEITSTEPGHIIGTPAYMSPEQARGKPTDKRSDIWSFGCIMFQMLTGQLPFEGETAADTLARIIERQPDWQLLPESTPINIRVLLRRCLEKEPGRRLGNIEDAAVEINDTMTKSATLHVVTRSAKPRKIAIIFGAVVISIVLLLITLKFIPQKEVSPSPKEIRLVVLPFENLGPADDEYFADGITDAITARLAGIHGLGVISRQSAIQYEKSEKKPQQIAKELRVDYILEGTVQRERPSDPNSRVRIIPQLINASEDTHIWTDIYDDDIGEVFRLQSDVAEQVAQALDITLLEPERQALKTKPTENMEAYEYFLRGNDYSSRNNTENEIRIAIQMYENAIDLDPTFALVYTKLAQVHDRMYWLYYDRSEERLTMAKRAVDKAFQLNPDLPEAYIALGRYYYHGYLDYESALEQFNIALKSRPNNSETLVAIGFTQRRQGRFEQALSSLKRAFELDPLDKVLGLEIAIICVLLHNYPEAERYYERIILLYPDWHSVYYRKAWLYLFWRGNTEKARAVLTEALRNTKSEENSVIVHSLITIDVYDRNYQEALDRLSLEPKEINSQAKFIPNSLQYAHIYRYMNKKELAKKYYDEARSILESKIDEQPEDARFHSSLGIAYAGLGRKEDAIREGKLGVELLPVAKEAYRGPNRVEDLARIYTMVGEYDLSIELLEYLLSIPGEISIPLLRIDPAWKPLYEHPRFQELLKSDK